MADRPRQFVIAGFVTVEKLLVAARKLTDVAKGEVETYTPYPVHGIEEALRLKKTIVPRMVAAGALFGVVGGYMLLWWVSTKAYPLNIGGRPLHSFPAFIPITFECGVLMSALTSFFGVLALLGYPRLYHPVFESPNFRRATIDRFFLSVQILGDERGAVESAVQETGPETIDFVTEQLQ
jgi:hypothetical protein